MSSTIKVNNIQNLAGDDSGIDLSTNDQIILKTANTTAITVDSSQNVTNAGDLTVSGAFTSQGIDDNATSTSINITSAGTVQIKDANFDLHDSADDVCGRLRASAGTNSVIIEADPANSSASSSMQFRIDNGERARINSGGHFLLGTTSTTPNPGVVLINDGRIGIGNSNGNSGNSFIEFRRNATQIGSVTQSGTTGVSYNTSSDHRLKQNVTADWDATTRLKQLNPVRFNFIADADTTVDGFLAHEVQSVVPEAISGTHNEVEVWKDGEELPDGVSVGDNKLDEDGNTIPVYQGIDQSKLVPLLVKTIQELEARITALESA